MQGHAQERRLAWLASGSGAILYEPSRLQLPSETDFSVAALTAAGRMQGIAQGRGAVWYVAEPDGRDTAGWVLRHYRRGGLARHFSADRFLWLGEARVRAFAELRLLAELERLALPAPRPVAARYTRAGTSYRADLLATRIAAARSFASALTGRPAAPVYSAIGACIRRFHDAGICHADLNANNVLIDATGKIHLIDFDRGSVRAPGEWRAANLARLRRSLRKISAGAAPAPADWSALLAGYAGGSPRSVKSR